MEIINSLSEHNIKLSYFQNKNVFENKNIGIGIWYCDMDVFHAILFVTEQNKHNQLNTIQYSSASNIWYFYSNRIQFGNDQMVHD